MKRFPLFAFLLLATACVILATSCKTKPPKPMRIALSRAGEKYINWLHRVDSTVEIVNMKGLEPDSAVKLLATCDGIVFTGGEDVQPGYYQKAFDSVRCESNPERDTLEFALIGEAQKLKLPIFGICRGHQILNIALGGSLIVDIPSDHPGKVVHRTKEESETWQHEVNILKDSHLYEIVKIERDSGISIHHQAIDKLAPGLRITAYADDSIPEATEYIDRANKPFFITVQWHPERMAPESQLSKPLAIAFIEAVKKYKLEKQNVAKQ